MRSAKTDVRQAFMARLLAQQLGDRLHETFVVENRPGAAGIIGSKVVVAKADSFGVGSPRKNFSFIGEVMSAGMILLALGSAKADMCGATRHVRFTVH
jgi:tripartite-type tricarboxylate transporter receptor subunit TctC